MRRPEWGKQGLKAQFSQEDASDGAFLAMEALVDQVAEEVCEFVDKQLDATYFGFTRMVYANKPGVGQVDPLLLSFFFGENHEHERVVNLRHLMWPPKTVKPEDEQAQAKVVAAALREFAGELESGAWREDF